jgi:hypothetical protein
MDFLFSKPMGPFLTLGLLYHSFEMHLRLLPVFGTYSEDEL